MLLRRITKHVTDQNWFAVCIDFLIVVIGILIAFQITNWSDSQHEKTNLANAEIAIKTDLLKIYMNSKERMALTKCRISSLRELGELLLEPTTLWKGLSRQDSDYEGRLAFNNVLRSPSREWGSSIWDAELARGTFNSMSTKRQEKIDRIFTFSKKNQTYQISILDNEANLKVLAYTIELPQSERLRYFDMVSTIDHRSYFIELFAGHLAKSIEDLGLKFKKDERENYRESIAEINRMASAIYGDCHESIVVPIFLLGPDAVE